MRLKPAVIAVFVTLAAAGLYAAMPFVAAWQIREAVRTGDTATLARKVDWASVRNSLKSSIGETRQALGELADLAGEPRPSLWQRLKVAALPYLTDPLIDRYVSAEGAPRLYEWRQTWRARVRPALGGSELPTLLADTWIGGTALDRGLSLARRVERAHFVSANRLEIELADRYVETRRWFAAMERRGFDWQLTEMKVVAVSQPAPRPTSPRLVGLR